MSETSSPETKDTVAASISRWAGLTAELKSWGGSPELTPLLQHLLRLVQKAAPEHAAGIFLLDEGTRTIQGQVTELFDHDLNMTQGVFQTALRQNAPYIISDLHARRRRSAPSDDFSSQIVIPFQLTAQVRGALILRSREPHAYTQADGEALAELARHASTFLDSALIHQRVAQVGDAESERDLVMAQEIMSRLIPREPPRIPEFDVASSYIPAKIVGGDLLNFVELPDNHYGFLVADASGHGVPAALLMTGFRALFRGLIKNNFNIRSVFHKANNQLIESTALPNQFVVAFYAELDVTTHRLIYVNAGSVQPLLYRPRNPVRKLDVGGPLLGVLPLAAYHEDSVVLHPQDVLVFYSDGLSEAENADHESFDTHRILRVVEEHQSETAASICAALQEEVLRFSGPALEDDLTICVLKFP